MLDIRLLMIFTILVVTFQTYGQQKYFGIKFSPLALADDINFRAIQIGFENRLKNRVTLYNEVGVKYYKSTFESNDTVWDKSNGFRYKIELRYYFRNIRDTKISLDKLKGFYVGTNLSYTQNSYNYQITYRLKNDSTGWKLDNFKVRKIIKSPNLIIGREIMLVKKIYLDIYCGLGLRIRTIESHHKEYNIETDILQRSIDVTLGSSRDIVNSEDKKTLLGNLTSGFRIGIKF